MRNLKIAALITLCYNRITQAITACVNAGENPDDHFARARKMVNIGSGAQKEVDEIALTRYACQPIPQTY